MNILEFKDLHIRYRCGAEAVKGVSFAAEEGSITAIVGESGSGKSTLLRASMGLLPVGGVITGGEILFRGKDICRCSGEQLRHLRGEQMAMIFQNAGDYLNPRRTIQSQYVEMLRCHEKIRTADCIARAQDTLKLLKLPDPDQVLQSYPFQLSGGMRQRTAVAMAMSMKPELLLADEPTSALDVTVQAQVVKEMMSLRDRFHTTILIVTHNMGVASRMADHILVMKRGQLCEFGTRDQVIHAPQHEYTKQLLSVVPELEVCDGR